MLSGAPTEELALGVARKSLDEATQRTSFAGWTMYLYTQDEDDTRFLQSQFRECGGTSIRLGSEAQMFAQLKGCRNHRCMLFMECSYGDDMNMFITRCLKIRELAPRMPVILVSAGFSYDEFSTSRLAICDASLRTPFARSSFANAMQVAVANNDLYRARMGLETRRQLAQSLSAVHADVAPEQEDRWLQPAALLGLIILLALPVWVGLITYVLKRIF